MEKFEEWLVKNKQQHPYTPIIFACDINRIIY